MGAKPADVILIERRRKEFVEYRTFDDVTEFLYNESTPISIIMCQLVK